ncbi:MAG: penicillin-binding protein 2 [Cypionkella sp.]|nr:penicillin-binding protein 2 [Cypionkella sp.]
MARKPKTPAEMGAGVTRRALLISAGMGAMVAALGTRMHQLGVSQGDKYRLLAEENRINIRLIPPARGQIFDRNGVPIASNEQNYRVVITKEDASKANGGVEAVIDRLCQIIPMTKEDTANALKALDRNSPFVPIPVAERLSWQDLSEVAVNSPALPGVSPEVGLSRTYPLQGDFAHVVGYVGPVSEKDLDGVENPDPLLRIPRFAIGKIGTERWMEGMLRGSAGTREIEVNAVGRVMRELSRQEGIAGADLHLTIDAKLQNFIQARLGDESAACVVMDVQNGDLVAAVSSPSFDPNLFVHGIGHADYNALLENDHRPLANKVVQGTYPPGSTFKMVTALAALTAGVIDTETRVRCPGYYESGGRRFHCWRGGGHGTVNLERSLMESCDVFYYDIAQRVGIDKIAEMGRNLGLGVRHDLPMSAIAEGNMPDKAWKSRVHNAEWRIGDTINASIGQGYVLTSPLQLAVMTARIASGKAVAPRLVKAIAGRDVPAAVAPSLGIEAGILASVQRGMFAVMNGRAGTAAASRIADETMVMCGKTGTAQVRNISTSERSTGVVRNENLPWEQRDHALFVGYAPADAPRYAVAVVVEHGGGGSAVAAPIARDALLATLTGGVPPLSAYPAAQRPTIEARFKKLSLRFGSDTDPLSTKI